MALIGKEMHLVSYVDPAGPPPAEAFRLVEVEVPEPGPGEVLVRNTWMSCDPGARGGMTNRPNERIKLYPLNAPPTAGAVGQVIKSNAEELSVGDYVRSSKGWREYFVAPVAELTRWEGAQGASHEAFGSLGASAKTAWVGLMDAAGGVEPGETVLVSAAAGAVGTHACQIAKIKGAGVVAIAGSDEKCAFLKDELGVDAAINYRTAPNLSEAITEAAPEGIDLYFENVGGEHLIAAIDNMKMHGRIAVCGLIDRYASRPGPAPQNFVQVLYKRLRIQGYIVGDAPHLDEAFADEMSAWLEEGKIKTFDTVHEGIENAHTAYAGLFTGANIGKTLVKLGPDPAF